MFYPGGSQAWCSIVKSAALQSGHPRPSVWSPAAMLLAVGSAVLSTEVSTIFPLHEAVGLWLEQMLWLTGIERLLQEEEVDLFQLMLKASFFKLHLLAKQSFRESPL